MTTQTEDGMDTMTAPTVEDAAAAMLRYVERGGSTTFVELEHACAMIGFATSGDLAIHLAETPNVVLWANVNDQFCHAWEQFQASGRVEWRRTISLTYLVDGRVLCLPIAIRPPKAGYREPHWLPLVYRAKEAA